MQSIVLAKIPLYFQLAYTRSLLYNVLNARIKYCFEDESAIKTIIRKLLPPLAALAAIGCAAVLSISWYVQTIGSKSVISPESAASLNADYILVLGAAVLPDGTPSNMLEDRLSTGIDLYEKGASAKLLLSGDSGDSDYNETSAMQSFSLAAGVPAKGIVVDESGFSTYESMYRAKNVFGAKKIVIVTQRYHLSRALYIANSMGLEAYGVNSDPRGYKNMLYNETRELAARNKDFFFLLFNVTPAL